MMKTTTNQTSEKKYQRSLQQLSYTAHNSKNIMRVVGRQATVYKDTNQFVIRFIFSDKTDYILNLTIGSDLYRRVITRMIGTEPENVEARQSTIPASQRGNALEQLKERFPQVYEAARINAVQKKVMFHQMPKFLQWPNDERRPEDMKMHFGDEAVTVKKAAHRQNFTYEKLYQGVAHFEHDISDAEKESIFEALKSEDDLPATEEALGLLEFLHEKKEFIEFIKKRA